MRLKCTNIIIDDFRYSDRNKIFGQYIYFLSHMHSDHFKGLTNDFSGGSIYCSE